MEDQMEKDETSQTVFEEIDELCINTIRGLAMDAIEKANSGHPGAPMGLAPAGYVLWTRFLRHDPKNPSWFNRDRFVLSGGHASMLIYSLLYLTGYDLTLDDIKSFRQWGSKTPGHPEYGLTPGVETTTGPLGQGFANAVGMAMAERHLAAVFNKEGHDIIDHYTYVMCGDGDLMEGISYEAASLAGHLGLGKLICIYDDNRISIEGNTTITFTEDVAMRFAALGWNVLKVTDGNEPGQIARAIEAAKRQAEKPTLIMVRTHIAHGSPNKQDSADAHGAPLGKEEVKATKKRLGLPEDKTFFVPEEVLEHCRKTLEKGDSIRKEWEKAFESYGKAFPELAQELSRRIEKKLPAAWDEGLPVFEKDHPPVATRKASGMVLNLLAGRLPELVGGSADLAPSNNTLIKDSYDFQKETPGGRNIRFGVREHAMAAITNGLSLHGGIRPYAGTFLVFADYMRPSIRLAALMGLPVIYIFTHDSIAVGEDGPTHQPVEHAASLRAIPNLHVFRPADANETVQAWKAALARTDGPCALLLSRQSLPVIDQETCAPASNTEKGGYVLCDPPSGTARVIIIATGSEVALALSAQKELEKEGIPARVVSIPCVERFDAMPEDYRNEVLPGDISMRIVIEAGIPMGWERFAGSSGIIMGIDRFGASAPGPVVYKEYGFTVDAVVKAAKKLVS